MPYKTIEKRRKYHREYCQREYAREKRLAYNDSRKEINKERENKYIPKRRIQGWKKHGVKGNLEELYKIWENTTHCNLCNVELVIGNKTSNRKILEHDHLSGHFRNIVCGKCNCLMLKMDNIRVRLNLEIHRYFFNKLFPL